MKPTMPALFIAHGSPLLALDETTGAMYRQWGESLPAPKAVLVFSAHWEGERLAVGELDTHRELIYDFGGFAPELYTIQYPAPGAPWLADVVSDILLPQHALEFNQRGLDHGVWVPLLHMWPRADVPVVQMSMPYAWEDQALFDLGASLSVLRREGVVIAGTGNVTHNLHAVNPHHGGDPLMWACAFDRWIENTLMRKDHAALLQWRTLAPDARMNHPTPEHLRPLFIAAGAAQHDDVSFPVQGFEWGSLSRRCAQFG